VRGKSREKEGVERGKEAWIGGQIREADRDPCWGTSGRIQSVTCVDPTEIPRGDQICGGIAGQTRGSG